MYSGVRNGMVFCIHHPQMTCPTKRSKNPHLYIPSFITSLLWPFHQNYFCSIVVPTPWSCWLYFPPMCMDTFPMVKHLRHFPNVNALEKWKDITCLCYGYVLSKALISLRRSIMLRSHDSCTLLGVYILFITINLSVLSIFMFTHITPSLFNTDHTILS